MRCSATVIFTLIVATLLAQADDAPMCGFTVERAGKQRTLESRYDANLRHENLRTWMKRMTVRPHHLGSPYVKANAEFIADQFRSWGFDVEIEVFHVLFPTPKTRELELVEPRRWRASLVEEVVASDSAAATLREEGLPPYNAYAADGEAVAELVYVNQGLPKDYEILDRRGIDVKGRVVIARYGGSWRGIKPKVAAERGALACILYNDPRDDGFFAGDSYPAGPFKPPTAVQRGSVVDLPKRPGDPSTPGYGGTTSAKRVARERSGTVMTIPVLPISWQDARPLLEALDGPVAPLSWRGALPLTYKIGPGPAKVRVKLENNWDLVPSYNVIAKLYGRLLPDEWVVRGNHHDSWAVGAKDPISGLVTLMEQARATASLLQTGWRPKRTIVFCAWDAEEPGLLGSTDWVEHHADVLRAKVVAYINTDGNARGFLHLQGSHALERMASEVADSVDDPQTGVSAAARVRSRYLASGSEEEKKRARESPSFRLAALGSGSDYTAFIHHLGIPSFNVAFYGESANGEYHTLFDTFDNYSKFHDPGFVYGIALAQVCGRLTLRLVEADVLPFEFSSAARTFATYIDAVVGLADSMRDDTKSWNELVKNGDVTRSEDPTLKLLPPELKTEVPHFNFAPILNAQKELEESSAVYDALLQAVLDGTQQLDQGKRGELDRHVARAEQSLTSSDGLPRRPWYRHQIYAPGYYTGYGVKTLPGVREALEERNWDEVREQIDRTAAAIVRYARAIDAAAAIVRPSPQQD